MDASATTTAIVKTSSYLFYSSIILFVIFLIMLAVHYYYKPFLPFIPSTQIVVDKSTTNKYESLIFYNDIKIHRAAPSNTALELAPLLDNNKDNFTLSFDCYIDGTYLSTDVPRVLFYFSSNAVTITNNNDLTEYYDTPDSETPRLLDVSNSDLIGKFGGTNFIVYVDPVKNDLKIGVFTISSSGTKRLEIASIIKNIPIRQVFQVTIVLTNKFLEVYMNKMMVDTYIIGSLSPKKTTGARQEIDASLVTVAANAKIYTPISFIGSTIKVANIHFYNGPLNSFQIRELIKPVLINSFFT